MPSPVAADGSRSSHNPQIMPGLLTRPLVLSQQLLPGMLASDTKPFESTQIVLVIPASVGNMNGSVTIWFSSSWNTAGAPVGGVIEPARAVETKMYGLVVEPV